MTKKQRSEHIKEINNMLVEVCGDPDRWGHYKIGEYRVKMQKTSLRLEKKEHKRWFKCASSYFININIDEFRKQLIYIKRK